MELYGRNEEIRKLSHLLKKQGEQMCLIYGRRRVGKSELIKHVIRSSQEKYIFYECKQTTEVKNPALRTRFVEDGTCGKP